METMEVWFEQNTVAEMDVTSTIRLQTMASVLLADFLLPSWLVSFDDASCHVEEAIYMEGNWGERLANSQPEHDALSLTGYEKPNTTNNQ